jgi:hypothetical protein
MVAKIQSILSSFGIENEDAAHAIADWVAAKDSVANKPKSLIGSSTDETLRMVGQALAEMFEAGFAVVTYKEGDETKNAFSKFGNDYAIEGIIGNIHDIFYSEDDDEDLDDGDLKKAIKDL